MDPLAALSVNARFGLLGVIVFIVVAGLAAPIIVPELNQSFPPPQLLVVSLVLAALAIQVFLGVYAAVVMLILSVLVVFTGAGVLTTEQFMDGISQILGVLRSGSTK